MVSVAFLNVPSGTRHPLTVYPPIGILSMGAGLRAAGHAVQFVDADVLGLSPEAACKAVTQQPDLIGLTLNIAQAAVAASYLETLRRTFPRAYLVAGGPLVSGVGERILDDFPLLDFAVLQEGERAILDLAELATGSRTPREVRNLIWRGPHGPVTNGVERIPDLDALPLPDYSLVAPFLHRYSAPEPSIAAPSLAIMCTRGCPFECAFCSSPGTWGRRMTFRSVPSIIEEIVYLRERFGVREIFFQDDTLNARPAWFFQLTDAIRERNLHKQILFRAPFRVNQAIVTEELLRRAREAGFWLIFYGVESGNQAMLDRMGKGVAVADIERAFALTSQAGLCSFASFMVGNEGETEATFRDSLALLHRIQPDFGGFAAAAPFPGSRLESHARAAGHVLEPDYRKYRWGDAILRTEALSAADIVRLAHQGNQVFSEITRSLQGRHAQFKRRRKRPAKWRTVLHDIAGCFRRKAA